MNSQVGIAPIAGAFIVAAAVLIVWPARPHDWYEGVTNAQGERCCGEKECAQLEDGDVKEIPGGFLIRSMGVTIPYAATLSGGHIVLIKSPPVLVSTACTAARSQVIVLGTIRHAILVDHLGVPEGEARRFDGVSAKENPARWAGVPWSAA